MKGTYGSFLAVFADGSHRAATGYFTRHTDFHFWVADQLRLVKGEVRRFWYAWGGESQEYTPGEVREVFFGE